jgi:hypothetical protein
VLEAVTLILGVRVDDLLDVRAMEPAEAVSVVSDDVLLDAERDARLRDLAERRDWGTVRSPRRKRANWRR